MKDMKWQWQNGGGIACLWITRSHAPRYLDAEMDGMETLRRVREADPDGTSDDVRARVNETAVKASAGGL